MIIAVSPYHLTTREAPAMASLLLAERVVTLVPAPVGGATAAAKVVRQVPTFDRLVRSWEWTEPLWRAGVISGEVGGEGAFADMWDVSRQLADDPTLAPLRAFVKHDLYDAEADYLGAVAADVLKGGPDPGISLPVAAGLDRFAQRHGLIAARSAPASVAQRVEARLARPLANLCVPIITQADAPRLLHAREVLAPGLARLRSALGALGQDCSLEDEAPAAALVPRLQDAAASYAHAFDEAREAVLEDAGSDAVRVIEGAATLSVVRLPCDAVLRSSLTAMSNLVPIATGQFPPAPEPLPVRADPWATRWVTTILVKPLGVKTSGR